MTTKISFEDAFKQCYPKAWERLYGENGKALVLTNKVEGKELVDL